MSMNPMTVLCHWEKNKQQTQKGPAGLSQITSQQEWLSGTARNGSQTTKEVKEKAEGRKAQNPEKPSP